MDLKEFLRTVGGKESDIIEITSESEALEAVKRNGLALPYVKDQTEAVCLEAVKQNGHALQYVKKSVFLRQ